MENKATNMTQDPTRTKMIQPVKTVKVKILRDVAVNEDGGPRILKEGSVEELPIEVARDLVNRKYNGVYAFSGERSAVEKVSTLRVAEKYVEPTPQDTDLIA